MRPYLERKRRERTRQSLAWFCMSMISAIRRLGQLEYEAKASLGYGRKFQASLNCETLSQEGEKSLTRLELSGASGAAGAVVTISFWNFAGKGSRVHYCDVNAILGRKPLDSWGLNQGPCAERVLFVNLFLRKALIVHPWLTWTFLCRPGTHRDPTASLCVSPGSFVQSKHKHFITELHPGLSSWNHLLSESRTLPPKS